VNLLGFPAFTAENGTQPASLTEAAQRPVYTTVSMLNDGLGNPTFGGVSAIFSNRYVANMSVIAPADTGNYEAACNRSKGHPAIVSTHRCTHEKSIECCLDRRAKTESPATDTAFYSGCPGSITVPLSVPTEMQRLAGAVPARDVSELPSHHPGE
jgi:hypothetical protein